MPDTRWKGPDKNGNFRGLLEKKYKGHQVKVSQEVHNQGNLPIKGAPSEHNVLSDCFIRKLIYSPFLLL